MPRRVGGSGGLALGEARGNPVGPPPTAVRDREWTNLARARRARDFFFSLVPSREGKTSAPTEGTRLSPRFPQPQLETQRQPKTTTIQPLFNPVGASRGAGATFPKQPKKQPVEFVLSPRPMVFSLSPLVASAGRTPFTIQPRANHKNFKGPPRRRDERLNSRYHGGVPALRRNHSLCVAN